MLMRADLALTALHASLVGTVRSNPLGVESSGPFAATTQLWSFGPGDREADGPVATAACGAAFWQVVKTREDGVA